MIMPQNERRSDSDSGGKHAASLSALCALSWKLRGCCTLSLHRTAISRAGSTTITLARQLSFGSSTTRCPIHPMPGRILKAAPLMLLTAARVQCHIWRMHKLSHIQSTEDEVTIRASDVNVAQRITNVDNRRTIFQPHSGDMLVA